MPRRTIRMLVMTLASSAFCVVIGSTPASAHTSPVASDPKPNLTIRALPEQLAMTFDGPILASFGSDASMLVVADPMHEFINAPTATVQENTLSTVLSPQMLMDGTYTVSFRAFGSDGHVSQGSWSFTVDSHLTDGEHPREAMVPVPAAGAASVTAVASGAGVLDGVGAPTGSATGTFDIDFATATMCYLITSTGLGDVTAAHIHSANMQNLTISDEIYLPIDVAAVNAKAPVCAKQDPQSLANLAADPSRFVLMIHTADDPDGAAAGPFRASSTDGNATPRMFEQISWANYRAWLSFAPLIVGVMAFGLAAWLKRRSQRHSPAGALTHGGPDVRSPCPAHPPRSGASLQTPLPQEAGHDGHVITGTGSRASG